MNKELNNMSLTTKRALAASLKSLLTNRTLDKITVKEITDDCGVNRQTFYYHFQDIYDLLEWIFLDDADRLLSGKKSYDTWQEGLRQILKYCQDNRALVLNAYHSLSRDSLENYLNRSIQPIISSIIDSVPDSSNVPAEDRAFLSKIYTYALSGLFLGWMSTNMKDDFEPDLNKFFRLAGGSLSYTLMKFSSQADD